MTEIGHRIVETNGIRMHIAEAGSGPTVLLCHGFPELWYSWRHQLAALAAAGFHAIAPDMRGYGQTDSPPEIDRYTLLHMVGDMVGLLDVLGVERAVIAGHDWGAPVAWLAAQLRPDRFPAVIALSVPFGYPPTRAHGTPQPTSVMPQTEDAVFYQLYFQEPEVAEAALDRNVRTAFRINRILISGDAPPGAPPWDGMVPRQGGLFSRVPEAPPLPAWLSEADVDYYMSEFARTGFRGALNWYRNIDRNWELLAPFDGVPVTVPALFLAGERDPVVKFPGAARRIADLPKFVPQLRGSILLPGCGHVIQEERAAEVSARMIAFLRGL